MDEEWKDIEGYGGAYQVSSQGRVRNAKGFILKATPDRRGYPRLRLSLGNVKSSLRVHVAVARAFIQNPENKPQVNHKDGDKTNNKVSNLEWMTNLENMRHAIGTGLVTYELGEGARATKRKIEITWPDGRVEVIAGSKALKDRGLDPRLVSACILGKRNTHRGCIFKEVLL